jgi:predicted small secreted protein
MKSSKILVILFLAFAIPVCMTACGDTSSISSDRQATGSQDAAQQATAQLALAAAETKASVDGLIGSWTDIASADRFVNITKTDTGYQYEDNEGKYPATFTEGVLKVEVSDSITVDVYIDATTGHMLSVYQENISEFSKK